MALETHRQVQNGLVKGYLVWNPPHPYPPSSGDLEILDLFLSGGEVSGWPNSGLTSPGIKLDHPLGPLHGPPHVGHDIDPGGGKYFPPVIPQCDMFVPWEDLNV